MCIANLFGSGVSNRPISNDRCPIRQFWIRIKRVAVFEEEVMQTQTEILEDVAVIIELVFVLKTDVSGVS